MLAAEFIKLTTAIRNICKGIVPCFRHAITTIMPVGMHVVEMMMATTTGHLINILSSILKPVVVAVA